MTGREERAENDLFFTCSLIEYIGRRTKNKRSVVANALGRARIEKIYHLVYIPRELIILHGRFDHPSRRF